MLTEDEEMKTYTTHLHHQDRHRLQTRGFIGKNFVCRDELLGLLKYIEPIWDSLMSIPHLSGSAALRAGPFAQEENCRRVVCQL